MTILKMRPYQQKCIDEVYDKWSKGFKFPCLVMPTGSGKSATGSEIVRIEAANGQLVLVLAHRRELITQLSHTLARNDIRHNVIAAKDTIQECHRQHVADFSHTFVSPNAKVFVGSVQSIKPEQLKFFASYKTRLTVLQDEFHHATKKSKTWGGILTPLVEVGCKGLGLTATPERADGKGLGADNDGYADCLVIGPTTRWLIKNGHLCEYRIFAPPIDLDLSHVAISKAKGDYQEDSLKAEMDKSTIVGDVVDHYVKIANGKTGLTFTVGVDMAEKTAAQYRERGINAIALSGKTPPHERSRAISDIQNGKLTMIVNDMLFTEGTDLPCVEVVVFARPTQSYPLYIQMFGRALRMFEGKEFAIIIDAVSNIKRHGLPDAPRELSLDARDKRGSSSADDVPPTRTCMDHVDDNGVITAPGCYGVFPRYQRVCPYCGLEVPPPDNRGGPEYVDGDLFELSPEALAALRGEVAEVDADVAPELTDDMLQTEIQRYRAELQRKHTPKLYEMAHCKRHGASYAEQYNADRDAHIAQKEAIAALREIMAEWGGWYRAAGCDDAEIMRRFYVAYSVDWLSAQALDADAAYQLMLRVVADVGEVML